MGVLIGFALILAGILAVMNKILKMQEEERENRMLASYMESVQESYKVAQERIDAVRRYRHDLAKNIRTLQYLTKEGQDDAGAREYLENIEASYREFQQEQYCRDEIVNSILSIKKQQCREREIPLQIQVEDIDYSKIQDTDMVGLLYNLLDNAVEAHERIPEGSTRGIFLSMGKKGEEILMNVENYICPGENVNFKTVKESPENHGIGTKIIEAAVEKYNGKKEISLDKEKNLLAVKVRLQTGGAGV